MKFAKNDMKAAKPGMQIAESSLKLFGLGLKSSFHDMQFFDFLNMCKPGCDFKKKLL